MRSRAPIRHFRKLILPAMPYFTEPKIEAQRKGAMGLDMKTKKKLTEETAKRYCTASKKNKTKILDEFIATTGYNRKYAIHVLKNSAYVKVTHFNNVARQSVQVITKTRKSARIKNITVKTYNKKSSGCGLFRCTCVQNGSCRSFGIISITLVKSSAMINN